MKPTSSLTRAIIEATVDRGLREIDEDPQRSIRKLIDLGRQFSNGRFVGEIYNIFQDLLRNEDSPYYYAIEHAMHWTSRTALKHFGINMGYNSFTLGGKIIRKREQESGCQTPWAISVVLDPSTPSSVSADELSDIVKQGIPLGIYVYNIPLVHNTDYINDLLPIFKKYKNCCFLICLPDEELGEKEAAILGENPNVMAFLDAYGDYVDANSIMLRRLKAWYGAYGIYDNYSFFTDHFPEFCRKCISAECSFVLTVARRGSSVELIEQAMKRVKEERLSPTYPLFIFDLYGDAMQIKKLLSESKCFFEIREDRTVFTDNGSFGPIEGTPNLEKLFQETLPLK